MMEVRSTLQGISRNLREVSRVLTDSDDTAAAKRKLNSCKTNLHRIRDAVNIENFNRMMSSVDELLDAIESNETEQVTVAPSNAESVVFHAERLQTGRRGRPKVDISKQQVEFLASKGFTAKMIADSLKCSTSWVYKFMKKEGLSPRSMYSDISDDELKEHVRRLHEDFPNSGAKMMLNYLKTDGIRVQRRRVRNALESVDPVGTASRWGSSVSRKVYSVPGPNSLWHIDGHLKLIRWGLVTHGCIDGFSRMVTFVKCSATNKATAVVDLFFMAAKEYGLPSRVRSDYGGENILVALLMNLLRGTERSSHLTGPSVNNSRIERLWYDVFRQVISTFYKKFYKMEDDGLLKEGDDIDLYALHFVFIDLINDRLTKWQMAWNSHSISGADHSWTPEQMWLTGMLNNHGSNQTFSSEVFSDTETLEQRLQSALHRNNLVPDNRSEEIMDGIHISNTQRQNILQAIEVFPNPVDRYLKCKDMVTQFLSDV